MGQFVPTGDTVTLLSIGLLIVLSLLSLKDHKRIMIAMLISLIGARLSSYTYIPHFHTACMLISLYLLINQTGIHRLIGLLYIPRVLISIAGTLYAILYENISLQVFFVASELFLWLQIILWIWALKNGDGGRRHSTSDRFHCCTISYYRALQIQFALFMDRLLQENK